MSPHPPLDSARLAWWLTGWLRGGTRPGEVLDAVRDGDAAHHVLGLTDEDEPVPLLLALPGLRRTGAHSAGLALPAPGHPAGLGGPAEFNRRALAAGEAVVLEGAGVGLVPHRAGAGVTWTVLPARPRPLIDLGEASRNLRRTLASTATDLAELEVARWNPEVADALMDLRHRTHFAHPGSVPTEAADLAARAQQALDIVELALGDDGTASTAREAGLRQQALTSLARAAREAWVAAASPEVWPPAPH